MFAAIERYYTCNNKRQRTPTYRIQGPYRLRYVPRVGFFSATSAIIYANHLKADMLHQIINLDVAILIFLRY